MVTAEGSEPEFVPLNHVKLVHTARTVVEQILLGRHQAGADEMAPLARAELAYVALTVAGWLTDATRAGGLDDDQTRELLDQVVADALAHELRRPGGEQDR